MGFKRNKYKNKMNFSNNYNTNQYTKMKYNNHNSNFNSNFNNNFFTNRRNFEQKPKRKSFGGQRKLNSNSNSNILSNSNINGTTFNNSNINVIINNLTIMNDDSDFTSIKTREIQKDESKFNNINVTLKRDNRRCKRKNKSKFSDDEQISYGNDDQEAEVSSFSSSIKSVNKKNKNKQEMFKYLNSQINLIVKKISINNKNKKERNDTFNRIKNMLERFLKVKIVMYGSSSSDLCLHSSDLDLSALTSYYNEDGEYYQKSLYTETEIMNRISSLIMREHMVEKNTFQLIRNCRVPLIKFTDRQSNLNVDITFNQKNGLTTVQMVRSIIKNRKLLKDSILFIKLILRQYDYNDASQGGISSFMLFHMVLIHYFFHLKLKLEILKNNKDISNVNDNDYDENEMILKNYDLTGKEISMLNLENKALKHVNIGEFIYSFFDFYGNDLENDVLGIYTNELMIKKEKSQRYNIEQNGSDLNEIENNDYKNDNNNNNRNVNLMNHINITHGQSCKNKFLYSADDSDLYLFNLNLDETDLFYLKKSQFPTCNKNGLSIQNLTDSELDVGSSARNFMEIKELFKIFKKQILKNYNSQEFNNLLKKSEINHLDINIDKHGFSNKDIYLFNKILRVDRNFN